MADQQKINSTEEYIASVHDEGRAWLREFYGYLGEHHSELVPVMFRQRPMYKVGQSYVLFTAAKHHFSVHTKDFDLIDSYRKEIPHSGKAKGCLNISYANTAAKPLLKKLIDEVIERNLSGRQSSQPSVVEKTRDEYLGVAFAASKAPWRPLYEQLHAKAVRTLPEFREHFPAVGVLWKHTSTFANITCTKAAMRIEFFADQLHEERNPIKYLQVSAHRVAHTVEITDESGFDKVISWIKESYDLTQKR